MINYKACLLISALSISVRANFPFERTKAIDKPEIDSDERFFEFASATILSNNYGNYRFPNTDDVNEEAIKKSSFFPIKGKKISREDKNLKKALSPYYTLTDKDSVKYRELVLKSGVPYCKETNENLKAIDFKSDGAKSTKGRKICYKCKNPKTGAKYAHCTYKSHPEASIRKDEVVETPFAVRYRRSTMESETTASKRSPNSEAADQFGQLQDPYRFGGELFSEPSGEIPEKYKKENEECDRIVKNSMMCLVCKDSKTKARYEQCSYVSKPNKEAYSYRKSSSFGDPANQESKQPIEETSKSEKQEGYPAEYTRSPSLIEDYHEKDLTKEKTEESDNPEEAKSIECKKVQRDSRSCTVCTDPKTNGNYEKCFYTYQPHDKIYKFDRSKSYGYPERAIDDSEYDRSDDLVEATDSPGESGYASDYVTKKRSDAYAKSEEPSKFVKRHRYDEFDRYGSPSETESPSESERNSEKMDANNCKKVQKDSMSCTVCKDPKTGGNYEQCSYSYEPKDKAYAYSKGRSFGTPSKSEEKSSIANATDGHRGFDDHDLEDKEKAKFAKRHRYDEFNRYGSPSDESPSESPSESSSEYRSESERNSEKMDANNCKKVQRDSMSCTVCKDPRTGDNYEQCSYSYEPKDKVYAYSKGRSFGTPSKSEEKSSIANATDGNREFDYRDLADKEKASDSESFGASVVDEAVAKEGDDRSGGIDFFDTSKKKAEIEKFLQEFQKEDRSNCKKVRKDKMTCYECLDENGTRREECMFVGDREPIKDRLTYREAKNYRLDKSGSEPQSSKTRRTTEKEKQSSDEIEGDSWLLEPAASASEISSVRKTKSTEESQETTQDQEELNEAEPYDFASETRPIYDKVSGLTLPAYMLTTSEHEAEFDEIVASSRI